MGILLDIKVVVKVIKELMCSINGYLKCCFCSLFFWNCFECNYI